MTKSLVTFIRKQLKVKGSSEHTGRGSWWCKADVPTAEVLQRAKALLPKWQEKGLVLDVAEESGRLVVLFSKEFDEYYRTLVVDVESERWYNFAVTFNMPTTEKLEK